MTLLFSSNNISVSVKIFCLDRRFLFTKLCMMKVRCIKQDEHGEQTIARVNAFVWF